MLGRKHYLGVKGNIGQIGTGRAILVQALRVPGS
jgi:hypothetical protein